MLNRILQSSIVLSYITISMLASCQKHPISKTNCVTTLYGYGGDMDINVSTTFGIINETTGKSSVIASFITSTGARLAAYNTSDQCYYVFKGFYDTLLKINSFGEITQLSRQPLDSGTYQSLVYNKLNSKMYCIKNGGLAEITVSGTTYSATIVVDNVGIYTVDNTTGDIYLSVPSIHTGGHFVTMIKKYSPVSASFTDITIDSNNVIIFNGLQFNDKDRMLYGVSFEGYDFNFAKIDPSNGNYTSFGPLSVSFNPDYYSTVIDPCSNHYIISSSGSISQLSMTGTLVSRINTKQALFQGLEIVN